MDLSGKNIAAIALIFVSSGLLLLIAGLQFYCITIVPVGLMAASTSKNMHSLHHSGIIERDYGRMETKAQESFPFVTSDAERATMLRELHDVIFLAADRFSQEECSISAIFTACFALYLFAVLAWGLNESTESALTTIAFLSGTVISNVVGFVAMRTSLYSNIRTAAASKQIGLWYCISTALRGGSCISFTLIAALILSLLLILFPLVSHYRLFDHWMVSSICLLGFAFGASVAALFSRVGGGLYTKAADMGADLVGKMFHQIPEDDPRNPAVIADLVGDNVGDIAGNTADIFGSLAESLCAAIVLTCVGTDLLSIDTTNYPWGAVCLPLLVTGTGGLISAIVFLFLLLLHPIESPDDVKSFHCFLLLITTVFMIPLFFALTFAFLPQAFLIHGLSRRYNSNPAWAAFACVVGLIGGVAASIVTTFYTSPSCAPAQRVAGAARDGGVASEVLSGLAFGYRSVVTPLVILAVTMYTAFMTADLYGLSLASVGLSAAATAILVSEGFGPICDNAAGIAKMARFPREMQEKLRGIPFSGYSCSSVGRMFALNSSMMSGVTLLGTFLLRLQTSRDFTNHDGQFWMLHELMVPTVAVFVLLGCCIPYWFSALTLRAVGEIAECVLIDVENQYINCPDLLNNPQTLHRPDYNRVVSICTRASLREMIAPVALVLFTPIAVGIFFGVAPLLGLIGGVIVTAYPLAISLGNAGDAWEGAQNFVRSNSSASVRTIDSKPDMLREILPVRAPDRQTIFSFDGSEPCSPALEEDMEDQTDYLACATRRGLAQSPDKPLNRAHHEMKKLQHIVSVCDIIGDPMKDTVGPGLNILIKVMAIEVLVLSAFFLAINRGQGLFG